MNHQSIIIIIIIGFAALDLPNRTMAASYSWLQCDSDTVQNAVTEPHFD
jgi:hypothetical protein